MNCAPIEARMTVMVIPPGTKPIGYPIRAPAIDHLERWIQAARRFPRRSLFGRAVATGRRCVAGSTSDMAPFVPRHRPRPYWRQRMPAWLSRDRRRAPDLLNFQLAILPSWG